MGRSAKYNSPSRKIRNLSRLVSYLKKKLKCYKETSSPLSLTNLSSCTKPPNNRRTNFTTSTSLTNYPEPCKVCDANQCEYDLNHQLYYTISGAVEKTFEEFNRSGALEKAFGMTNLEEEPPDEIKIFQVLVVVDSHTQMVKFSTWRHPILYVYLYTI